MFVDLLHSISIYVLLCRPYKTYIDIRHTVMTIMYEGLSHDMFYT